MIVTVAGINICSDAGECGSLVETLVSPHASHVYSSVLYLNRLIVGIPDRY